VGYAQFQAGVKVLIRNGEGRYLLVLSHDRGWEIPGGGVEEGEDLLTALHREVDEEVGIKIRHEKLAGVYTNHTPPAKLLFWFLAEIDSGEPGLSDEVREVAWVPREDLAGRISHPSFRDRVEDLLKFDGAIRYRAFKSTPYLKDLSYEVLREAMI
jgi:8-oxo-dGTP diphosphatase